MRYLGFAAKLEIIFYIKNALVVKVYTRTVSPTAERER